jgi:DNA repair protein RadC
MKQKRLDDPNYKIIDKGVNTLSDVETLSIIMAGTNSIERARIIYSHCEFNFNMVTKLSYADMVKNGLSHSQATRLIATGEFMKRRSIQAFPDRFQIKCSKDMADLFTPYLQDLDHEEFWVVYLNRSNKILHREKMSQGGINGTVTDIRIILRVALEYKASGLIICHNHPSGNLNPSESDTRITQKVKEAGNIFDVQLLDHIIVSEKEYYSFADNGIL